MGCTPCYIYYYFSSKQRLYLLFARGFHDITEDEKAMIKTCRQSILYGTDSQPRTKKTSNFDVTMGSLYGAEISEFIGLYMLNEAENNISGLNSANNGLYRDDGLIMLDQCSGPRREKTIKDLHKLYKSHGLRITIASTGPVGLNFGDTSDDYRVLCTYMKRFVE